MAGPRKITLVLTPEQYASLGTAVAMHQDELAQTPRAHDARAVLTSAWRAVYAAWSHPEQS